MEYSADLLQHIENVLKPIENTLTIMLKHKNVKPESKEKILQNITALESFRGTLNLLHASEIKSASLL